MSAEPVQFGQIFLVFIVTFSIAAAGVLVGSLAFRRSHYLIDYSEAISRRLSNASTDMDSRHDRGRINLIVLAVFLLWIALMTGIVGIRLVLA